MNETSPLVWGLADGQRNVGEISKIVCQKLNYAISEDLTWFALEQLKKENLSE